MANGMYPNAKVELLTAGIDFTETTGDVIKVDLIDTDDYTYSAAHDFHDDITGVAGAVVATGTLASKTTTAGVFDAADTTLSAVTGDVSEALILWMDTSTGSTSPVILYLDTGITGSPVTPNGGDIVVQWNGSGIFTL